MGLTPELCESEGFAKVSLYINKTFQSLTATRRPSMIQINQLTKYYGDFCAVDHIDFDIKDSEILGLLGPNGAGKTTTIRMLTGYFKPNSGTIQIDNYSIDKNLLKIKDMIGYLPESAPLYSSMIVYDYLNFVAYIRGLDRSKSDARIEELVALCGLNNIMHKTIRALSKGLKQRVGLAHAMMKDPEILILDEPTSGLDPNQIVEIRNIIRQIGKEKTVILSTHILSEVEATCDRAVIINKGKIVADDLIKDMVKGIGEDRTIIYLSFLEASLDDVKNKIIPIDGVIAIQEIKSSDKNALRLKLTCANKSSLRKKIYQIIKKTDWILIEFSQETKDLETIFRELTKEK